MMVASATVALPLSKARSATSLTAVEWGPPYIDATKKVCENWTKSGLIWELHKGGAATILAKIRATWPHVPYDLVDAYPPVFTSMAREKWHVPLSVETVPNLAYVPEALITKDEAGRWVSAPRNVNYNLFAYRKDTSPIEIKSIRDLYDPRLKGQIAWPNAASYAGLWVVVLALANGGDEHDVEPGWKALRELAKTGNIGRIVSQNSELINSFNLGETSVTFADTASLTGVGKHFPIQFLSKTDESLKVFPAAEGWCVLASSNNQQEALELVNFLISPDHSTTLCEMVNLVPASTRAKTPTQLSAVAFSPEELKKYVYAPDWGYLSTQLPSWVQRFEADIIPLIK